MEIATLSFDYFRSLSTAEKFMIGGQITGQPFQFHLISRRDPVDKARKIITGLSKSLLVLPTNLKHNLYFRKRVNLDMLFSENKYSTW